MQAFRAAVTVDTDHELHIEQVPFRPGSVVEVIVLPAESESLEDGAAPTSAGRSTAADESRQSPNGSALARAQYRLAGQYPKDYVVLVGERIVFRSSDRQVAFGAYDQACRDFPEVVPVIVEPGGRERRAPLFRGRTLTTSDGFSR